MVILATRALYYYNPYPYFPLTFMISLLRKCPSVLRLTYITSKENQIHSISSCFTPLYIFYVNSTSPICLPVYEKLLCSFSSSVFDPKSRYVHLQAVRLLCWKEGSVNFVLGILCGLSELIKRRGTSFLII